VWDKREDRFGGARTDSEQQRYTSTLVAEPLIDLDILIKVHVECSIERSATRGDARIMPEWGLGDGARTDEDHP
jgi:hypothetical protein